MRREIGQEAVDARLLRRGEANLVLWQAQVAASGLGELAFENGLDDDLPCVHADPGQLEQVFTNIIVNAIDAMSQQGALEVTTRAAFNAPGEAQYAEILFADSGCGITPENLERVFEPFFTTKEVGKGTGLGLFICYGIIEKHGGTIDIESKLGKGTTLKIRLPISGRQSEKA